MVTRFGLVTKIEHFSLQNGDEIGFRRQKMVFLASKWRREQGSSPKNQVPRLKMVTRFGLVAKIEHFSLQNGDEIGFRRQNRAFFTSKR
ncbi:hypothetical protein P5F77_08710 [Caldifermentibacillus hisashii]|uniref:hypothetical protein n=1 Tax=Caldifermentibacillus hisashii TaxID=996558 RepID=UPI0030D643F2